MVAGRGGVCHLDYKWLYLNESSFSYVFYAFELLCIYELNIYSSHVDNTCAERQKWKPDDHITRHTWSVCRTSPQMTSNFLDNACTKIQNMAFKTSQMDQIALEYWYYGFLGRLRVDGRGFLHQKPFLEKRSPQQKSRCRTCAEACHNPFNLDCKTVRIFAFSSTRARKTLTPRFTDFFTDFEKKNRLFCSLL